MTLHRTMETLKRKNAETNSEFGERAAKIAGPGRYIESKNGVLCYQCQIVNQVEDEDSILTIHAESICYNCYE